MNNIIYATEIFESNRNYWTQISNHTNNQDHSHDFFEIFYVLTGPATQTLNGGKTPVYPNELFILRPNDHHSFSSPDLNFIHRDFGVKAGAFQEICNTLAPNIYKNIISSVTSIRFSLTPSKMEELEHLFSLIENGNQEEHKEMLSKFILIEILSVFYQQYILISNKSSTSIWIERLVAELKSPYNFCISLNEIISKYPFNRSYLCRAFKKHTGKTPNEYFNDIKLSHAYLQIKTTSLSISHIAYSIGFPHRSFFYKKFKEKYGCSPNDLR